MSDSFINNKYNRKKIIHVDMDCFYASVELRDKPHLKFKPVAVAGSSQSRGVITTCNYIARKSGIKSAMPSIKAKKLCPNLIFLPVNMEKYKTVSNEIYQVYKCYTKIIEPVSLDEAYLDVTNSKYCNGDPEEMARQIRKKILDDFKITASAGISCNKFLSKVASDWNKPNGQFAVPDSEIDEFVLNIPLKKIPGVGEKTLLILNKNSIKTCEDIQNTKEIDLINMLGKYGTTLHNLCRGIDDRIVEVNKISKSLSVEDTYESDISDIEECIEKLNILYLELISRLNKPQYLNRPIKSCFIKIKYNDFKTTTSQMSCAEVHYEIFEKLLKKNNSSIQKPIRLLGVGVQFNNNPNNQLNLNIL